MDSEPALADARLHHTPALQRGPRHWRAGVCPSSATQQNGTAKPATTYASSHPRSFQEAPETHVSLTWQHGIFPNITMQSSVTGVSPMPCIGKMERFQPPELHPNGPQRPEYGTQALHEAAFRISGLPKLRHPCPHLGTRGRKSGAMGGGGFLSRWPKRATKCKR